MEMKVIKEDHSQSVVLELKVMVVDIENWAKTLLKTLKGFLSYTNVNHDTLYQSRKNCLRRRYSTEGLFSISVHSSLFIMETATKHNLSLTILNYHIAPVNYLSHDIRRVLCQTK